MGIMTETEKYTETRGTEPVVSQRSLWVTLPIPDMQSTESLQEFRQTLLPLQGRHGVPTLLKHTDTLLKRKRLFDRAAQTVTNAVHRLNGRRTEAQKLGDSKRSAAYAAQRFYEGLSVSARALSNHAKVAGLNPDLYATKAELISALVQWYHHEYGREKALS